MMTNLKDKRQGARNSTDSRSLVALLRCWLTCPEICRRLAPTNATSLDAFVKIALDPINDVGIVWLTDYKQTHRVRTITMTEAPDEGPFFHGTIADLRVGDFLTAGYRSNYRPEVVMNHIYFTALVDGAGLAAEIAAELAKDDAVPRVYVVEPTGTFENDPNVTDKKFPGNPTRSYRSSAPLRIIGEITQWTRLTPEALQVWRERLTSLRSDERGGIIN